MFLYDCFWKVCAVEVILDQALMLFGWGAALYPPEERVKQGVHHPLTVGWGKTALQNTYGSVNKPHSHPVPPLCGGKRSVGPSQKGGSRAMAAAWQWAQSIPSPGSPWWLQPPHSTARSLTHLQSLRKCSLFSAKTRISSFRIQSVSESFPYFHIFLRKCHVFVSSKGVECPPHFLCFFNISQEQTNVSYQATIITELKSSLPHPGKKPIVSNIFLLSNPYICNEKVQSYFSPFPKNLSVDLNCFFLIFKHFSGSF